MPGREGVVGEVKSVSWGGALTKGEVHKRELTLQEHLVCEFNRSIH